MSKYGFDPKLIHGTLRVNADEWSDICAALAFLANQLPPDETRRRIVALEKNIQDQFAETVSPESILAVISGGIPQ